MIKSIALLTDGIHPFVLGGMQKHSLGLCRALAWSGVKVILFHGIPEGNPVPSNEEVVQAIFPNGNLPSVLPEINTVIFPAAGKVPGHYLRRSKRFSREIARQLNQYKVDLIYCQGFTGWTILENKMRQAPVWVNFHGLNMFQKSFGWRAQLESFMLRGPVKSQSQRADKVISLGGRLTEILLEMGISSSKILVQPNGLDQFWYEHTEKIKINTPRKILFVGRNDKVKGLDLLFPVLNMFTTDKVEFHFVGPFYSSESKNNSNIIFHGVISDETEMRSLMDKMDFAICSSYSEGMPTFLLEAMSRSCALISTDVGAVSELVTTQNGILIIPGSTEALYSGIKKGIEMSDEELLNMKQASLSHAAKFTWNSIVQSMDVGA